MIKSNIIKFILIILIIGSISCVGPLVRVIDLDEASALQLRKTVQIYNNEDIKTLSYRRLGQIQSTSCMNKIWDKPASQENAVDQLRYKASSLGGNGLSNLICENVEGTNLAKNCWSSVTCYAVAIIVYSGDAAESQPEDSGEQRGSSSGSGFIVTKDKHILTNQHVVDKCSKVNIRSGGLLYEARIIKIDRHNDLALLIADGLDGRPLPFRTEQRIRAGESVIAIGYPLVGLLSQEPHVTTGTITALSGIKDDTRYIQVSTPVQPGNSGGPLVDLSGRVIGVIVSKLNALKVAVAIGDIPQNVNFAINSRIAEAFLDANAIEYKRSNHSLDRDTADIADEVKSSTVLVECMH